MNKNPYELQLREELNQIFAGSYDKMDIIPDYPLVIGLKILSVLTEYACKGQNTEPILLARNQLKKIPIGWLIQFFPEVAQKNIDFEDEWEFRRLLELVHEAIPHLLKKYIEYGLMSQNEEVKEAAEDFVSKIIH
ncbi:hypothetical protein P4V47_21935 [Brevibacillus laterosporus]|uniref:hypothetical protein n=1 Tax=Brevibacillus laterosporus TaxID=1465 RepID=UPI002E232049|nr:hypothetical protein [Brevibacillus laterosporus]